jgi:hypothetical protein
LILEVRSSCFEILNERLLNMLKVLLQFLKCPLIHLRFTIYDLCCVVFANNKRNQCCNLLSIKVFSFSF